MTSEIIYELWEHGQSGEVFAVRLDHRRAITGCRGPLFSNQLHAPPLLEAAYDDDPADLAWIEKHRESWVPSDFQSPPHY